MRKHSVGRGLRLPRTIWLALILALSFGAVCGSASAAPAVGWSISGTSAPTVFTQGEAPEPGELAISAAPQFSLEVSNVGAATSTGPLTITATLPAGITASAVVPPAVLNEARGEGAGLRQACAVAGQVVTCELKEERAKVVSGGLVLVYLPVVITRGPGSADLRLEVDGGGAPPVSRTIPAQIGAASPPFGFLPGTQGMEGTLVSEAGTAPTQAGSHPYGLSLEANVPTERLAGSIPLQEVLPVEELRSLSFTLPRGLVVDPLATSTRCTEAELVSASRAKVEEGVGCPLSSQVGTILVQPNSASGRFLWKPIYNMVAPPGAPAEFGLNVVGTIVHIRAGVDGKLLLTGGSSDIVAKLHLSGAKISLWGNPSAESHDYVRAGTGFSRTCQSRAEMGNALEGEVACPVLRSATPLLTMPSSCSASMEFGAQVTSWEQPVGSPAHEGSAFLTDPSGAVESVTGCETLAFAPSAATETTSHSTASPTGLAFDLDVPQNEGLNTLATANLKKVSVALPSGMTINPPAADGLGACSEAQAGIGNSEPQTCPNSSKVGSAEIVTPLLENPLKGSVYLAEQHNNPFGTLLALYLAVEGEGVVIKLPGRIDADPQTGQLTATFDNNPELPFSDLKVEFNSGDRATLATPSSCGTYNSDIELTSWASATPVAVSSPMQITEGCGTGGFSPKLEAGTTNPVAGSYSPFTLRVTRESGEQNVSRISATLPEGLLAKLAGVPLCPAAQAAADTCSASSQIGTTTTGVGAGNQPLYIPQPGRSPTAVYLAGPYEGAPFSLVIRVPAEAGPFNLGTIAVRVALNVNSTTAQVSASSDPLPQILEGIPISYRDIRVEVTKPEFIVNPTSCEPKQITSTITSIAGASASPATRFQVAGCESLAYKPKLALSLSGPTKRGKFPALKAVLTQPAGQANNGRVAVTLPPSLFIAQGHIGNPCTRVQFNEGGGNGERCPAISVLGTATAYTPLLAQPLTGKVYFRSNGGERKLPDLVAALQGEVNLNLVGFVDSVKKKGSEVSRIRNIFASVPDAAVSRFVLKLNSGKRSILQNSKNLCEVANKATVKVTGQNGKVEESEPKVTVKCGRGKGKKKPAAKSDKR